MEQLYPVRNILCIDLKSFFAACECVDRGLDIFTTPLVVADPARGNGAITLAVTPYLKNKGIPSRGRIFEIPKTLEYLRVKPRMSLYIKKSSEVVDIFLDYIAKEDLHVYSIDECFLDVTDYLKLYKKTDYELALEILETIKNKTGLYATCGIGSNLLMAKIAMDIEAKNNSDFIAKWDYRDIPSKLWAISPLSKMWGIGSAMERKLNSLGIKNVGELARFSKDILKEKYGVMGEQLWYHANGIDLSRISDWKEPPKEKSINHSQILFKDYYGNNIKLIISEMTEVLVTRLRKAKKTTGLLGFGIGYSKSMQGGFYHSMKLDNQTDDVRILTDLCYLIFEQYYKNNLPIRKVSLSFSKLLDKNSVQLNLFETLEQKCEYDSISEVIDNVRDKFGKNSIINASGLLSDSTIRERNKKTGGHFE